MTTAKGQYRKRRTTTLNKIPRNIQQWFAGERRFTFYAYTHPHRQHLQDYWDAFLEEHPDAVKPAGLDNAIATGRRPDRENSQTV